MGLHPLKYYKNLSHKNLEFLKKKWVEMNFLAQQNIKIHN